MSVFSQIVRVVRLSCQFPIIVVLSSIVLAACSVGYSATHFAMDTNTSALFSPDVDWRKDEADLFRTFPQNADATLVIVDGATPELAHSAAAALAERLSADRRWIEAVRRPDGGAFFDRNALLFGSAQEAQASTAALLQALPLLDPLARDPSIRGVAGAFGTAMMGAEMGAAPLADMAPVLGAAADTLERFAAGEPARFSWTRIFEGGFGKAPSRQLLLVQPKLDFGALTPGAASSAAILAAAKNLKLDPAHGVTVRLTGAIPLADEEFSTLAENMSVVGFVMLAAMVVTLWLAVRSARIVVAIVVNILISLAITTALGLWAVTSFNLISVAFIPLFVGLGVDFGIQLSVRFNAERLEVDGAAEAMTRAANALGGPLLLAAGAVFLGFGAFLPTAYVGIAELGVVAGLGMVIALVFSLTLLPALLVLLKPGRPRGDVGFAWAAPADRWLERRRSLVLWAFAIAMVASVASLPLVRFDFNPMHLRDPKTPGMTALADLVRDPLRTPNAVSVIAPDVAAATALAAKAQALPTVSQAITIDSFVPADQAPKLAAVGEAKAQLAASFAAAPAPPPSDAESVGALRDMANRLNRVAGAASGAAKADAERLAAALARVAEGPPAPRAEAIALFVDPLKVTLDRLRASLEAGPVSRETLPPEIARDWLAPDGRALVQIFPRGDSEDNETLARFTDDIRALAPNASGLAVTTQAAARTVSWAFIQAGVLALGLVTVLLLAVLRDLREVAFTLAPVVLSGFLTLGTCVVIGQPLNFANIIAFPLLFGVGVAFHIYFVMAWRNGATDLLQSSLARAVLFSALATGTAFGSLWLSSHPGTASMGKILMLSLAWTLVCALIFEPALLGPPRRETTKKARAG